MAEKLLCAKGWEFYREAIPVAKGAGSEDEAKNQLELVAQRYSHTSGRALRGVQKILDKFFRKSKF